jgi:localization factor PodJL
MQSGDPWKLRGSRREAQETARQAARRAGMSVGEWLDSVISAEQDHVQSRHPAREHPENATAGEQGERAFDDNRYPAHRPAAPVAEAGYQESDATEQVRELNARVDGLTRQLTRVAQLSEATASRAASRDQEPPRQLAEVISKLDRRLNQLIIEAHAAKTGKEQPAASARGAAAEVKAKRPSAASEPATPLDQAMLEIADRQRALDGKATAEPAPLPSTPESLPRPHTQDLSGLEQQLRGINSQIADLKQPCGVDRAIDTLRDDLAEIGVMLQDALPRKSVEALEREVRNLADRIEQTRNAGVEGSALIGVERGLAEVRDALRSLSPAENLVGFDDALASLSQEVRELAGKVDRATDNESGGILSALEERIAALAGAVERRNQGSQGVPHELEAAISALVDKIEHVQLTNNSHAALGHLEDRIAKLVEKLDASDARLNHLEAIERGLAELLIHLEHQRVPNVVRGSAELDELSRDLAELRQTEQKTRETLEIVHGTLGHVVDRLGMIETGIRNAPARRVEEWLTEAFSRRSKSKEPEPHAVAAGTNGKPKKSHPPAEASASLPSASAPSLQSVQPIDLEDALESDAAPATSPERRPLDPDLPPDHPLEPGTPGRTVRLPGERIAGSESAAAAKRPPGSDIGGKSSFIAAARRAAQAASRESAVKSAIGGPTNIASAAGKLANRIRKLRALIAATAGVLIVLGALQVARIWLAASEPPDQSAPVQQVPGSSERPPDPVLTKPSSGPEPAQPSVGRQSNLSPVSGTADNTVPVPDIAPEGALSEGQPPRMAVPGNERDVTGSIAGVEKTPAAKPSHAPPSPTAAQQQAAADKLPATFSTALRNSANKGDASAQYEVAVRFADGHGVTQNLTEAAEWFERAAKRGLAPAQFRLAGLYEKGLGVKKNIETARRYYLSAGEAGHAKALHNLAVLYAEGVDGKPDYQAAARWFHKAADYGVADSQYNLAVLYARGIGVEQNLAEAYKWFALAALQGDVESARKRDELEARLDAPALNAAMQAVQSWMPEHQPETAVEVKSPAGGWDAATAASTPGGKRKPVIVGPKLDLATPVQAQ